MGQQAQHSRAKLMYEVATAQIDEHSFAILT
jgi:hypothetical protein